MDPGSSGTGLTFFRNNKLISSQSINSERCIWRDKCDEICYKVKAFIHYQLTSEITENCQIWCETPEYFDTLKGNVAAKADSLVKLTTLYGRFWQIAVDFNCLFGTILAKTWKGQLNKLQTANRIEKILGKTFATSHETDAVGIGLYLMGRF